ncbi:Mu transposase domain-containing protein [Caballeronia cordobensis]|uniref:Mu transposase domain-containing protein n=1 Tax=Caballeronia cordobensis TaxID=1353886 RepID=UPI0039B8AEE6
MIKDVLRLKFDGGFSHDRIAASLGISKGVVTKYVGLAGAAGLDWAIARDMDEGELERRLLGKPTGPAAYAQPDYGRIHQELRRKGVTLTLLWEEYQAEFANRKTYRYTQFCEHYKAFAKRLKRSMRQIHRAGEKLFVDFAGPTLPLTTGRRAHIFVAAMGASSYTFACATPAETILKNLNERPFQKLPGCRASAFTELDAPALQPLPVQPYELARFKAVTVHIDYHIEIDKHRYSVPHALVGLKLDARITAGAVELLHRGRRVASHARNDRVGGYTTVVEHMPAAHRAHLEWTPQRLIHWGQQIGGATGALVARLLQEQRHPEHGYRACLGLLSLSRRYGRDRLEAACALALELGVHRYRHVRDILINNRDRAAATTPVEWVSPSHAHVRGSSYYHVWTPPVCQAVFS